jgi:ABC-type branched-subunit amino acid transport system substrate-binding protein
MKIKKGILIAVTALLVFSLAAPVWSEGQKEAEQPDEFVLGFMSSLSGTFAAVAETQKMGAELAVEQANEDGGLDMPWGKVPVRMIVKDDGVHTVNFLPFSIHANGR